MPLDEESEPFLNSTCSCLLQNIARHQSESTKKELAFNLKPSFWLLRGSQHLTSISFGIACHYSPSPANTFLSSSVKWSPKPFQSIYLHIALSLNHSVWPTKVQRGKGPLLGPYSMLGNNAFGMFLSLQILQALIQFCQIAVSAYARAEYSISQLAIFSPYITQLLPFFSVSTTTRHEK
jgi:hypothetical protein